jgi:thiamine-phosphate diphosphorylase
MRPVICMITDRQRLPPGGDLVEQVRAAAEAGVDLVQVRERDLEAGALLHLVRRCVAAVHGVRTRVLVNDRLDVALAGAAHGLHLRGDSLRAARARTITPPAFVIGRSVHSAAEAHEVSAGGGLDYLVFGPVFATGSKPGRTPAGIDALREVVGATTLPVLAVGGIAPDTMPVIAASGAAGVAAIGAFTGGTRAIHDLVRAAIDTPWGAT